VQQLIMLFGLLLPPAEQLQGLCSFAAPATSFPAELLNL
jgi:hypothetical protein